jgi:hypothetical protein
LRDARRWGAYVAMAFGLLLLLFTASFIYDMYYPERQGPDDYFGILFVPFTLLVACRREFVTADASGGFGVLPPNGAGICRVGVDVSAELSRQVGD